MILPSPRADSLWFFSTPSIPPTLTPFLLLVLLYLAPLPLRLCLSASHPALLSALQSLKSLHCSLISAALSQTHCRNLVHLLSWTFVLQSRDLFWPVALHRSLLGSVMAQSPPWTLHDCMNVLFLAEAFCTRFFISSFKYIRFQYIKNPYKSVWFCLFVSANL